jgi:hypothetical protein
MSVVDQIEQALTLPIGPAVTMVREFWEPHLTALCRYIRAAELLYQDRDPWTDEEGAKRIADFQSARRKLGLTEKE